MVTVTSDRFVINTGIRNKLTADFSGLMLACVGEEPVIGGL